MTSITMTCEADKVLQQLKFNGLYVEKVSTDKTIDAHSFVALIDTGATMTGITRKVIQALGLTSTGETTNNTAQSEPIKVDLYRVNLFLNKDFYIHRMGICRNLIKAGTDNNLDVFDDPAFVKYKHYFEQ